MKLLVAAVLVLGCGSKKSEKPKPDPEPETITNLQPNLAPCIPPPGHACTYAHCGGNSALINSFPVHGLRPNGDCNEDQMQLVPGSMDGKCKGMTLDIESDKLIGRSASGKCENKDLEGVSFAIRTTQGSELITISEVTEYTAPNLKKLTAYRMDWKENSGQKSALCAKEGQKLRKELGVEAMRWSDDVPDAQHELVIPVVSELYTDTGAAVTTPRAWWQDKTKLEWIHLACVDDALAKRTINGQLTSDPQASRAALRMWTADYCGGRPFTLRGKMIDWSHNTNLPLEAQWTENGASCLTKPRIIFENGNETVPTKTTKLLDELCKASQKDCKELQTWIDEAKRCTKDNNAFHRVETLADCVACTPPSCMQSRNVK